jgi:glycerate kinase
MSPRVLIVPDKFKGTLSARQAARAIARGWRAARPGDALQLLPMSDGGDGFGEVLGDLLDAAPRRLRTRDAAHRRRNTIWWWAPRSKTAILESARVIGLARLPAAKFHPFQLDTFGLGAALRAAQSAGAKKILVGIGGSATNDGGFGVARALGWKFFDCQGRLIERWTDLHRLARVRPPTVRGFGKITVAVDVQNPLLGARGATRVYGPQKGLRPDDLAPAESCLRQLARIWRRQTGRDFARLPGAGAAGGLGFGLRAFLGARLTPGFALFARLASVSRRLRAADLVLTGEGAIDRSTVMGKGVGQVARWCRQAGVPCVGLAGAAVRSRAASRLFDRVYAITDLTSEAEAKAKPAQWLAKLAARAASEFTRAATRPRASRRGCATPARPPTGGRAKA